MVFDSKFNGFFFGPRYSLPPSFMKIGPAVLETGGVGIRRNSGARTTACSIKSTGGHYQLYKLRIIIITLDPKTPNKRFLNIVFTIISWFLLPHQTRTGREVRAASVDSNAPSS